MILRVANSVIKKEISLSSPPDVFICINESQQHSNCEYFESFGLKQDLKTTHFETENKSTLHYTKVVCSFQT